jgi:LacI family transcriptional regulator
MKIAIEKNKLVYVELANELREKILSGAYSGNDNKLPPERELASGFEVNRLTLRKALDILRREKLIYRLGTKGTYVRSRKSIKKNRKKTIAFVLVGRDMFDRFHSSTMLNLERASRKFNSRIMFTSIRTPEDVENILGGYVRDKEVDGIIFTGLVSREIAEQIYQLDVFSVLLGGLLEDDGFEANFDRVCLDSFDYSCKAVDYLISKGRKKIALVNGDKPYSWFKNIDAGYRRALTDAGMTMDEFAVKCSENEPVKTYRVMKKLIRDFCPDAIFTANERLLWSVVDAIRDEGLKIGGDIDLITVGADSLTYSFPGVEAVVFDSGHFADATIALLLERLEKPDKEIEEKIINTGILTGGV